MKPFRIALVIVVLMMVPFTLHAQTSYPMVMSTKPVAARVGQSSELEVSSRYSLWGATKVLLTGEGVTGEVVTKFEAAKDGKTPNVTKIKVKFTVAANALPGVRDFRIATPQGASTLGQLVIVRDPIIVENGKNDTPDKATKITLPATVCGAIEKTEDVDFYKFKVEKGQSLSFHVRSMRLQNKLHDFQRHSDPILSLRNATGSTLAQSDNYFAGDPFLAYTFENAGEYLLEIRDVRYQGNTYWEYSIEVTDAPFVETVFPLGVTPGQQTNLEMVGVHLPSDTQVVLNLPAETPPGPRWVQLPLKDGRLTNPVPIVVNNLAAVTESSSENNTPASAQPIPIPTGISGRIESEADIDCYTFEVKKGEKLSVEVIARRQQSSLDSIIRILNKDGKQLIEQDDLSLSRQQSSDSWIENWTAPADGKYTIEIRDLHLRGGAAFVYFIKVTRSQPYFELYLDSDKTQLTPGTNGVIFARVVRKNGFSGEVQLGISELPKGVTADCGRILNVTRNPDGCIILEAAADARPLVSNITVTGTATFETADGKKMELSAVAVPRQETYMPGGGRSHWTAQMHTVSVAAPNDIRRLSLSTHDISLKPGESKRIDVTIERAPGFDKNITLDLLYRHLSSMFGYTLPEGVTIDTKNSKTLLTAKESKGHITITVAENAKPIEKQQISVMANISLNFVMKATYSSKPVTITIEKSATAEPAKK